MSCVLATPVRSSPSKNTSMMSRERSKRRRSSCGDSLLTKFIARTPPLPNHEPLPPKLLTLLADDESRNHAAARRDVGEFRERETRKGRADLAVKKQRVEVNQLLRVEDRAVFGERGEGLARRWDALLHKIVAVCERRAQRLVPRRRVVVPADVDAVASVVVVGLQDESVAVKAYEFEEVNRLAVALGLLVANLARPGDVAAYDLALFRREEARVTLVCEDGEERLLVNEIRAEVVDEADGARAIRF